MRALRKAHPEAALAQRSALIVARLSELYEYRSAASIALFWPLSREVDLRSLDALARAEKKRVYYPVMDAIASGYATGFGLSNHPDELAPRSQPFLEPPLDAPRAQRGDIDLILVPALAVGANGH